ncbi:MAG: hypothetical protein ACI8XW_002108 [Gammaproteobacteria bacterium]|jgi:hypothetical protein
MEFLVGTTHICLKNEYLSLKMDACIEDQQVIDKILSHPKK